MKRNRGINSANKKRSVDEQSKVSLDDFIVGDLLGKGVFGEVRTCTQKATGKLFCVKIIKQNNESAKCEARLMSKFEYPFVLSSKFTFSHKESLYIVMPIANGGDMHTLLPDDKSFCEQRVRFYTAELVSAIGYLHSLDIVHRDIKLQNILLESSGHIKICDFGLSGENMPYGVTSTQRAGTPMYMAPEQLTGHYDRSVDWWALGVVVFRMSCGQFPFAKKSIQLRIWNSVIPDSRLSSEIKDLLVGMLEKNPTKRLGGGPTDYEEVQKHSFFVTTDWTNLPNVTPPFIPNSR